MKQIQIPSQHNFFGWSFLFDLAVIYLKKNFFYWFERDRNSDLLFDLFMLTSVDSSMCPDRGSNLQPCHIEMMLWPTEQRRQGDLVFKLSEYLTSLRRWFTPVLSMLLFIENSLWDLRYLLLTTSVVQIDLA